MPHLATAGLDAYVADMTDVLGRIKSRLGGVVEVFPNVPLLLAAARTSPH